MATDQQEVLEPHTALNGAETAAKLEQLKMSAMKEYALKNYSAAAELYSEAAELQDDINGEMAPENADVLYQYGRSLYHVGVSKSDVLGGKVAQQEEPKRKKRKIEPESSKASSSKVPEPAPSSTYTGELKPAIPAQSNGGTTLTADSKPFFQITGDENWTDSEEEDVDEAEGEAEEEDDDLAIAYEILDTARVLFKRNIDSLAKAPDQHQQELRLLRERLADTHDLQAEIKLENEQFSDAVNDAREALNIKLQLFPQESGMVAEAHYKLSIALDFASLPTQSAADDADQPQVKQEDGQVDEALRQEAAENMEKAIMSCHAKLKKEEAQLSTLKGNKLESTKRGIADTQDMIKDMKVRLADLRSSPSMTAASADQKGETRGLLGELLGSSKAEQSRRIQEATQQANDLSGLVKQRKKPKPESQASAETIAGKGKRKAEDVEPDGMVTEKKVKFEVDL